MRAAEPRYRDRREAATTTTTATASTCSDSTRRLFSAPP